MRKEQSAKRKEEDAIAALTGDCHRINFIRPRQDVRWNPDDFGFSILRHGSGQVLDCGLFDHRITLLALAKTFGGIMRRSAWPL
jgi:hypothetical protein